ncbi:sushi domain-containing protein 3 [Callorhinchus milii]|uniref:sushi domain-containing protein 3 n=1 Tax=Callorhinchus milii TaxID=7868 RepID=UPI0004572E92|nr:sushi domain-containing protein 3 [Callorhinchus milii]|eukprot:gi/632970283/ref/XP_007901563.1/ PREDICTED: sushi domain-containing protein 3 [Callorhinchus milii]
MQPSTEPMVNNSESSVYSRDDNTGPKGKGQCRPVASPRFGSHSLQGGNGTNQGTKISFRCLPAYQLVGNEKILCVAKGNSTDWTGTFPECQAVPVRNEFGFKVAVIASIISSAIILLLSTAFLTCCLVKCVKKNERRKQRGVQTWFQIECDVGEDPRAPYYGNKSRYNHNNNNSSGCCDKFRDTRLVADVERGLENRGFCRCQEQILEDFRVTVCCAENEQWRILQQQNAHVSKTSGLVESEMGQESVPAKHMVLTHAAVHQPRSKEGNHIPSHPP